MKRYHAGLILAAAGVVTLYFLFQLPHLTFNYVFEDFFPQDDPELDVYQQFKESFGEDNNYLLVGIENPEGIFEEDFLIGISELSDSLNNLSHTLEVRSITTVKTPILGPAGIFMVPLVHPDDPSRYTSDSIRLVKSPQFVGSLISREFTAVGILVRHTNITNKEESDQYLGDIRRLVSRFPHHHLAGKIHAQEIFVSKMQTELMIFLSASLLLIILFLAFAYRSIWLTILPLAVVFIGAVWILGLMAITDKPLDILMVLLPTIMFVVGMSDVVHILTKYLEQLRLRRTKIQALRITFREVGLATFLTSLTTAVGFFTLLTASITPIRGFGIYTGIGVFFAFVVAFSIMPASLYLMKKPTVARHMEHRSRWFHFLNRCFRFLMSHTHHVLGAAALITLAGIIGIQQIEINTYLIEDLPDNDPLKSDFTYFDDNFGGSRPFEMIVSANSGDVLDEQVVQQMLIVDDYLKDTYGVDQPVGPLQAVRSVNQAVNGGTSAYYRLPESEREKSRTDRYLRRFVKGSAYKNMFSPGLDSARISGRMDDQGSAITLEKTDALRTYIRENTDTTVVQFTVTGTSNLIDKNNEYLARNMFQGLAIAFGIVAIIAGLLFRSLRVVLITLIPNIIPLIMVAAIMGYFGISLKLSTSIVFTIAFGIAVDDTLHFISKLKLELQKGKPLMFALRRTYLSTGKAIIVTSIILSGGFLILLLSSFGGTFYTGLLISLTLLFALVTDLTLLPVLFILFYTPDLKKTKQISYTSNVHG